MSRYRMCGSRTWMMGSVSAAPTRGGGLRQASLTPASDRSRAAVRPVPSASMFPARLFIVSRAASKGGSCGAHEGAAGKRASGGSFFRRGGGEALHDGLDVLLLAPVVAGEDLDHFSALP